jgi:hypothetical protein
VDEAVLDRARAAVARQQAMPGGEQLTEFGQPFPQLHRCIRVVVQMHLDLAVTAPAQACQRIQQFLVVLFNRIEKRVPRRSAVAVMKSREQIGVVVHPPIHSVARLLSGNAAVKWLEVVGDA